MTKYVILHAGLKVGKKTYGIGEMVELEAEFVAEHDPKGLNFVTEKKYAALVAQVAASKMAQSKFDEKMADLATEKAKLEALKVSSKHLLAIEAIKAAKGQAEVKPESKKDGDK